MTVNNNRNCLSSNWIPVGTVLCGLVLLGTGVALLCLRNQTTTASYPFLFKDSTWKILSGTGATLLVITPFIAITQKILSISDDDEEISEPPPLLSKASGTVENKKKTELVLEVFQKSELEEWLGVSPKEIEALSGCVQRAWEAMVDSKATYACVGKKQALTPFRLEQNKNSQEVTLHIISRKCHFLGGYKKVRYSRSYTFQPQENSWQWSMSSTMFGRSYDKIEDVKGKSERESRTQRIRGGVNAHKQISKIHGVQCAKVPGMHSRDKRKIETFQKRYDTSLNNVKDCDEQLHHAYSLVDSLNAMHKAGWVHGDLKRHNIFISGNEALLADFDMSTQTGGLSNSQNHWDIVGRATGRATPWTDTISFACMLAKIVLGTKKVQMLAIPHGADGLEWRHQLVKDEDFWEPQDKNYHAIAQKIKAAFACDVAFADYLKKQKIAKGSELESENVQVRKQAWDKLRDDFNASHPNTPMLSIREMFPQEDLPEK